MVSDMRNPAGSTWVDIGVIEDLPLGTMKRVDLGRHRILVANVEGTPLAVADTCTHEDASLSMGALKGDKVKCPLHGSRFCLRSGRALDEPAQVDLESYSVRLSNGRLEVAINRNDS
ncbi:MAG: non-heme iron oxygenase ferredoxin subunit [Arenicellales bacterium]|jgi:nitrite reductase/ring-hydroxylating ferredoxin subunit|nr:non-heme iron oxygenase ferredoxin subunit [Arenicellales bacterium]MDP6918127.1 non-heme iron oxygenase ferredoxin subunit [Arenicellales bacterium]|tara:strand:- start:181 stop:531 length:351 start_codon:yes stop_codon:yes gene_type:complete